MSDWPNTRLAAQIRVWCAELGLSNVGFARPQMRDAAARHGRWIAQGKNGTMAWLERRMAERGDPSLLLPALKSAIVVTQHYGDNGDVFGELARANRGYIARYARGRVDYHDHLKAKLFTLAKKLEHATPGMTHRVYVDTGPLSEKNLAQQAGIGWQGKHTNLIDPKGGNWFFLGVLLTSLHLPDAHPIEDHCGDCTACIDVCPTGALTAPYQLDARRCISYLTIELKTPIPPNLRPPIGNHIFGCDDCLAICPWNRLAPDFARVGTSNKVPMDVTRENTQGDVMTNVTRENTPGDVMTNAPRENTPGDTMTNAPRENAPGDTMTNAPHENAPGDTMANVTHENASGDTMANVTHENAPGDTVVNAAADLPVGFIAGGSDFHPYASRPITDGAELIDLMALTREDFSRHFKRTPLFRTKRRGVLRNVAVALGNWGDPKALPVLVKALGDDEPLIRGHVAWALGRIGGTAARAALNAAQLDEPDGWVREEISTALGGMT